MLKQSQNLLFDGSCSNPSSRLSGFKRAKRQMAERRVRRTRLAQLPEQTLEPDGTKAPPDVAAAAKAPPDEASCGGGKTNHRARTNGRSPLGGTRNGPHGAPLPHP